MKNIKEKIISICRSSLVASKNLSETKNSERNKALRIIAKNLIKNKSYILMQNKKI